MYILVYVCVYIYIYILFIFYFKHSTTPCGPSRSKYVTMAHVQGFPQNPPAIDCLVDLPYRMGACVCAFGPKTKIREVDLFFSIFPRVVRNNPKLTTSYFLNVFETRTKAFINNYDIIIRYRGTLSNRIRWHCTKPLQLYFRH